LRRVALKKQSLNLKSMKTPSSMSPVLKRYIVTFENGKKLKLMATNKGRALDLCAIVTNHPIKSIDQAVVQIKIEKPCLS
jgi:hypothetical protein